MQSSGRRILLKVAASAGVIAASAWIALELFNYWDSSGAASGWPTRSTRNLIEITEATYGASCRKAPAAPGQASGVKDGNVTAAVAKICDKAIDDCQFGASTVDLGDPAPGCGKDLSISWRCGAGQTVRRLHIPAEADGKLVTISCLGR
jgi:hypothetical protein